MDISMLAFEPLVSLPGELCSFLPLCFSHMPAWDVFLGIKGLTYLLFSQVLGKKYVRCSVRMMVMHLLKFLRRKLNVPESKEVWLH